MTKSGLADSPLFSLPQQQSSPAPLSGRPSTSGAETKAQTEEPKTPRKPSDHETMQPRHREATTPRFHDTMVSWYHDTIIELVRRAVRQFGKEAATHRFTIEEKETIAEIIYSYKSRGIKTSENEIARIAINFIIHDWREHGEHSVLYKTLKELNR